MKALLEAISDRFTVEALLKAALTGGLHFGEAPREATPPYAACWVTEIPFFTFDEDLSTFTVFFVLVSKQRGPVEVLDLCESFKTCFDEAALTHDDYHFLRFKRDSSSLRRLDGQWVMSLEYTCWVQKL